MNKEVLLDIVHEVREIRRDAAVHREREQDADARRLDAQAEVVEDIMVDVLEKHYPETFSENEFRLACSPLCAENIPDLV